MAKLTPLFSGSSGNSTYIGCGDSGILVDVGVSAKATKEALIERNIDPEKIKAIFVTHEHIDHIKGVRVFAEKFKVPVFSSPQTMETLEKMGVATEKMVTNSFSGSIELDDYRITRFDVSHDCVGTSGYVLETPDLKKIAVCTDLGVVSETVKNALNGCQTVVIESNHDVQMLLKGSYPYPLKQRIIGEKGHLSNGDCALEIARLCDLGATRFVLAHLSRENNKPEIAENTTVATLFGKQMKKDRDYTLYVAPAKGGKVTVF